MFPTGCRPCSFAIYLVPQALIKLLSHIGSISRWQRDTLSSLCRYLGFTLIPLIQQLAGRCSTDNTGMRTSLKRHVRYMPGRSFCPVKVPDGFEWFGDVVRMVKRAKVRESDGVAPWLRVEWGDAID